MQATKEDILSIVTQTAQWYPKALVIQRAAFEKDLMPLDGLAMAIREEGACMGDYGLVEMWPGVARAWGLFSEELLKDHPGALCMHIKRQMKQARWRTLNRIEATAGVDHATGIEFLEWLGFTREGLMRRYTPTGEDTYLYAKVSDVV